MTCVIAEICGSFFLQGPFVDPVKEHFVLHVRKKTAMPITP